MINGRERIRCAISILVNPTLDSASILLSMSPVVMPISDGATWAFWIKEKSVQGGNLSLMYDTSWFCSALYILWYRIDPLFSRSCLPMIIASPLSSSWHFSPFCSSSIIPSSCIITSSLGLVISSYFNTSSCSSR